MSDYTRALELKDVPAPPLFKLVDAAGADIFQDTEVGGEPASVGALFASWELAREFSAGAAEFGMGGLSGLEPRELADRNAVEVYAASGSDYLLVVSGEGTGLFHAGDIAHHVAESEGKVLFPLYLFSDEKGESPLISVEEDNGEVLVTTLFSTPEKAHAFREKATHLGLPSSLGTMEGADGLRRHALVARQAGAEYAVIDPESGLTEAIPLEELIHQNTQNL